MMHADRNVADIFSLLSEVLVFDKGSFKDGAY